MTAADRSTNHACHQHEANTITQYAIFHHKQETSALRKSESRAEHNDEHQSEMLFSQFCAT